MASKWILSTGDRRFASSLNLPCKSPVRWTRQYRTCACVWTNKTEKGATHQRNTIIGDEYRWPIPVPYVLEDDLDISAKAAVLEGFERFRLKTCIDFKPWEGEQNYISVFKGDGCYSYVGNLRRGKQQLSLGTGCDYVMTSQHEFLHALGFWHEQSRSDRDDYVTIMWDRIQPGWEYSFDMYDDTRIDSLNVPYDYTSLMHYSKTAFQIGTEPTIVTKDPAFNDVIGQGMDFSDYDLEKLSRLYKCSSSITFMDTCTFEVNNICGMIQGKGDNGDWNRVLHSTAGPSNDHTHLGTCKDSGYYMHFSTSTGNAGEKAVLESRLFYPNRGFQCLEFFYYYNGNENDALNIWIREYTKAYPNGILTFITSIKGNPAEYWQLHHVSLNVNNKFRVVFEGVKGNGPSNGGFAIDDINLSEALCPHYIWHIRNFANQSLQESGVFSPPFYSEDGYAYQIYIGPDGRHDKPNQRAMFFFLISGANDDTLQWPCSLKQATMELMDQNPDIRKRISNPMHIITYPTEVYSNGVLLWDKPSKIGARHTFPNGTEFFRGPGFGHLEFINHDRLHSREFLKGGDAYILVSAKDISHLNASQPSQPTPIPTTTQPIEVHKECEGYGCKNYGICVLENGTPVCRCKVTKDWWYVGEKCERKVSSQDTLVIAVSSSVTIFVVMLIITLTSLFCLKKKHKKQLANTGKAQTTRNQYVS
ncbi:hypothetical protein XELAEV_18031973mg [Xenopus laevis]|uniref:Meprin A subunit n=1 Tax=Xenopus laevis TaxID=8355 RepID=A0A974CQE7_XENLA|nr:hypothetical protein XELAEV_18031973mg [Xenopus laevis]